MDKTDPCNPEISSFRRTSLPFYSMKEADFLVNADESDSYRKEIEPFRKMYFGPKQVFLS